jgi:hypothetical protein
MSENIPHSLGGFRGAFESEHGRKPTEQEIWNAAIRSWRDLTKQKSDTAKERVVDLLLEYAGDNGYSHIDYADTMRHAAALLQSPALPDAGKRDTPFTNCRFQICDLPGQCKGEGKCHHPAVPAALPASDTPKIGCVQHDCAECQARAALPVGELTDRQILDIAKIDCRIEFSNDDIEEDAQIETTITFARAILAAAQTAPALVPLTSEHHFAIRQGHQIAAEDEYFAARPQIDNNDRRKVYEAGFNRGFDIAHGIT